jgi:exopolysaccharide biosynthesis polyprenyl glycosylphosphotransferase
MTPVSTAQQPKPESGARVLPFPGLKMVRPPAPSDAPHQTFGHGGHVARELLRATDVAVAVTALVAVFALTNTEQMLGGINDFLLVRVTPKNLALLAGFVLFWPFIFALFGLYDVARSAGRAREALRVIGACSLGALVTLPFLLTSGGAFQLSTVTGFWVAVTGATLLTRSLLRVRMPAARTAATRHVLIVGSGPRALDLYRRLTSEPHARQTVVGFVDSDAGMLGEIGLHTLGTLEQLESILMRRAVDEVLIALPIKSCYAQIQDAIDVCERVGVEAHYLADVFRHSLARPRYVSSPGVPVVSLKAVPDELHLALKRVFDIVGAAVGLVLLAPLFLVVAAAIKLTSPGPVFFGQHRYGYNRRLFRMYKFRTMVPDAEALQGSVEHLNEAQGPVFKIRDDPRVTPFGRFLRRTSIDELPQLFNVLKGDMSLVGPRPLPTRDVHNFADAWLMRRFSVVPGCTGLWQVSGRSNLGFDDWATLDLRYIDQWSLRLDTKILLQTIPAIFRGTGAS